VSDDTTLPTGMDRVDEPSGSLRLRWAARTDEGQVRTENEDALLAQDGLWVVADGMGGHQAGEVASALAIETLRDGGTDGIDDTAGLAALVHRANARIRSASLDNRSQLGMGTTLTAMALLAGTADSESGANDDDNVDESGSDSAGRATPEPDRVAVVNVGDSRTYLLRRGRLRRLTVDHSYVQELVNDGQITDEEARLHPRRNIVTRALGIDDTVVVDTWTLTPAMGDRFLLCSDGLVDEVPDHEIADVLIGVTDTDETADALLAMALRHGGRDNVTVVVVDVADGPPLPDDTEELQTEPHWAEGTPEPDHWGPDDGTSPEDTDTVDDVDTATDDPTTLAQPALVDATPHPPLERRRRRPRLATLVFWTVIGAVLVGAFVVVASYARTGWFVGLDGDDVVIYKGRPGGVLWFSPTVEAPTLLTADDLSAELLAEVEGEPTFGSEDAAARYVDDLRDQVASQAADEEDDTGVTTTTRPRTTTTTAAASTTTGP
jgi:protein phosphatase